MEYHYSYGPDSPLVKISSIPAKESTRQTVYLYAAEDAAAGSMQPLVTALKAQGYTDYFPDWREGKACLTIREVKDTEGLRAWLAQRGDLQGAPLDQQQVPNEDDAVSPSCIRQNSARIIGVSGASGCILRGVSHILQGDMAGIMAYGSALPSMVIMGYYGAGEGEPADELMKQAKDALVTQGVELPQTVDSPSWFWRMERFVARHPVQTVFAMWIPFGVNMIRSGLHIRCDAIPRWWCWVR